MSQRVVILHTSDLHGKLPTMAQEVIEGLRRDAPAALLVDGGDALGAGNLGYRPREPVLDAMNRLGYQAMAVGNREAHVWQAMMARKVAPARFPVLSANVTARRQLPVKPYIVLETAGVRVGLIGLTVPMITRRMWTRHLCDILFEDPVRAANDMVPLVASQADLVVVLSHLGIAGDRRLAEEVPGIHLILGGHSHVETHTPVAVNGVVLVHPGAWSRYVAYVEVSLGCGDGVSISSRLVPMRADVPVRGQHSAPSHLAGTAGSGAEA
jgi:2',3'-cyclic-nucleotide 2'-phosphodiesterase (5'-nucleotidase family)